MPLFCKDLTPRNWVEQLVDGLSHVRIDNHSAEPNLVLSEICLVRSKNSKIRVNLNLLSTSGSVSFALREGNSPF